MQVDPLTIFAVGGVASLLIERFFYYKSKYKQKNSKPENPSHGERIATLEEAVENIKEDITEIKGKLK